LIQKESWTAGFRYNFLSGTAEGR